MPINQNIRPNAQQDINIKSNIRIKNLTYVYDVKTPFKRLALDDISLEINEGDFFGIIGPTGSGKSTLISHINGLLKLMQGSIEVNDIDLSRKYDYKKLRSIVGMVFQYPEYQLFANTVFEDVAFGPRNLKLDKNEIEFRVREAISLVGLDFDSIAERSPFEISGGQMRRVAIAGVLAMQPKILILDEPTAGLDPIGKMQILELIHKIRESFCPTTIMISHNMDEIYAHCNRIALLNNARLVTTLSASELYDNRHLIVQSGLELPQSFLLCEKLEKMGYDIKPTQNEDELCDRIALAVNNGPAK